MAACVTLSECSPAERALWLDQAERVFFETAYTNSFDSAADRQAFLERWFGNYAETYPQAFLL
ncbi:MAG: GNAT family N-acetyltransferase, partial [Rhodomicrobium sp.]